MRSRVLIEFTLPVRPATKKNSGQIININGRNILLPSKQYKQFEKDSLPYLQHVKGQIGMITYPVNMQCIFFTETKRKIDLPNLLNAIDDAAVKAGLFIDDNRDIIASHDGSRVFYDKFNPRIEIVITKLNDYAQWKDTQTVQRRLL